MSSDNHFTIDGVQELLANLQKVKKNANAAGIKAITAGAKVIQKAISEKAKTHDRTSAANLTKKYSPGQHMSDNIGISPVKIENGELFVEVGPQRGDNNHFFYAKFIEFGAAEHDMTITKGPYKGKVIHHPGVEPKPFVEPALIEKRDEAMAVIARVVEEAIKNV